MFSHKGRNLGIALSAYVKTLFRREAIKSEDISNEVEVLPLYSRGTAITKLGPSHQLLLAGGVKSLIAIIDCPIMPTIVST
jgi:hypothetical protein